MNFVYLHVALALWMLVIEESRGRRSPHRRSKRLPVDVRDDRTEPSSGVPTSKVDHDYQDVETLLVENTNLTRTINEMTAELHHHVLGGPASAPTTE
jgi:hypothetical protein